jgi:exonuclease III
MVTGLMPIDRKSKCKNGTIIQPVASLKTLIKTNNLADIWRKCNQDKQQFTWRRKDKTQASRIDMIFIGTWYSTSCSIELLIFQ